MLTFGIIQHFGEIFLHFEDSPFGKYYLILGPLDHTAVPGLYLDTFWLSNDILQLYVSKRTITEYMTMDSLLSNYICLTAKAGIETWKIMCTILHFS